MLPSLFGRQDYLRLLQSHAEVALAGRPQLAVLRGPRRVGKTLLCQHLLASLEDRATSIYFAASHGSAREDARLFAKQVMDSAPSTSHPWDELLNRLVDLAIDEPVVAVIDEAPYLMQSDPAWASRLQRAWDRARHMGQPCHLLVCLTGSAVAVLTEATSAAGPLFGRADLQLHLPPFDLPTSTAFLGMADRPVEAIEAYAACGGYPMLLQQWEPEKATSENLVERAGQPAGPLLSQGEAIQAGLFPRPKTRETLTQIGRGSQRYSEISGKLGSAHTERELDVLQKAGLVERVTPIDKHDQRRTRYRLADIYLQFWYRVLERHQQLIDAGQGHQVFDRVLDTQWTHHVADVFEREARSHAARLVAQGELPSMTIGEWWIDQPRPAQIDVAGIGPDGWALVGEAKWTRRFGTRELRSFEGHVNTADVRSREVETCLWAKDAVDSSVVAQVPQMRIFRPADMVRQSPLRSEAPD